MLLLGFFYLGWSGTALVENIMQKEERDNHKEIWKEVSKRACVKGLRWEESCQNIPRMYFLIAILKRVSQSNNLFQDHSCD